jgi:ABC-type glycerol-3-phosphate transport system substrate-binding protein
MDLDGRELVLLVIQAGRGDNRWDYDLTDKERTPNDTLEIIATLRQIEKDYNCTITIDWQLASGLIEKLQANKAVGETPYDIFETGLTEFGVQGLYTNRLVLPVTHPAIFDVIKPHDNPWLPASSFTVVGGTQFGVHFKPQNSPDILRSTLIFNKTYMETFALSNFYEMVRNYTWNWDNFDTILNQFNAMSDTIFPIIHGHEGLIVPQFIAANNGTLALSTPEGIIFVGHENDNALEAMNFVRSFAERGFFHPQSGNRDAPVGLAASRGEVLFIFNWFDTMKNLTRQHPGHDGDYSFGILPPPMGPRATEYTTSVYTEVLYHIMADIPHPEEAAAVLVAMANRTRMKTDTKILHELRFSLQDEASAEMMQIMLNNVTVDLSRIHGSARSAGGDTIVAGMNRMLRGEETPVQAMQRIAPQMQNWFNQLNSLDN